MIERCHCGLPLHYRSPKSYAAVERQIAQAGGNQFVNVTCEGRTWKVQRHYIALHGLNASELADLGFEEVFEDE